jgi:hypothetical protein
VRCEQKPSRLRGLRRGVQVLLAVIALVVAVLVALAQLGDALRRLVDAWRPFWGP